jgi:hypothetical protein
MIAYTKHKKGYNYPFVNLAYQMFILFMSDYLVLPEYNKYLLTPLT